MSHTVKELLDAAKALPDEDRAELAELLSATLPKPSSTLHPAWADVLKRRAAEVDSEKVKLIPRDEARRRIQAILDGEFGNG